MIKLYAPADTEDVPILEEGVRKKKRIVAYITFSLGMLVALITDNNMITNILVLANLFQTITITKFIYKLTNSKYGYEVYGDTSNEIVWYKICTGNILCYIDFYTKEGMFMLKFLAKTAEKYAKSTNTACVVFLVFHQPKMPKCMIKKD